MTKGKKIKRSRDERIIFGVCGGIAEYFQTDPLIIRLIFVALTFGGASGVLIYIICALVIPSESDNKQENSDKLDEFVGEVSKRAGELKKESGGNDLKFILGLILVFLGISSLFSMFFPAINMLAIIWPFILVALGFFVLMRKK